MGWSSLRVVWEQSYIGRDMCVHQQLPLGGAWELGVVWDLGLNLAWEQSVCQSLVFKGKMGLKIEGFEGYFTF